MADLIPDLGKYASYVLGSYGVGLGIIAALVIVTLRANAKARAELAELEARGGPRR